MGLDYGRKYTMGNIPKERLKNSKGGHNTRYVDIWSYDTKELLQVGQTMKKAAKLTKLSFRQLTYQCIKNRLKTIEDCESNAGYIIKYSEKPLF